MENKLILFTRYPAAGKCKTRLIPALGPEGAARLHRRLSEEMLARMRVFAQTGEMSLEIRFAGGSRAEMTGWLGPEISCRPQEGEDIGARLAQAFSRAFAEGAEKVVIVGADCPGLSPEILGNAFAALNGHDLVLGPARDGGYYLVGLARPAPELFAGIPWGEDGVLAASLARAAGLNLSHQLLAPLSDLDRPEDLDCLADSFPAGLCPVREGEEPVISVIIPALNEEAEIAHAVAAIAGEPGVEVIVSDGGSRDRTAIMAMAAGARLVPSPPGRGGQQNAGARKARGRILLFLHVDTRLPENFSAQIIAALTQPEVTAGAFRFAVEAGGRRFRLLEALVNWRAELWQLPYGDQALFMTAARFAAIGGFKEIPLCEDLELVLRLGKLGRIAMLANPATTSARRWQRLGFFRTAIINQLILLGFLCRIAPERLARWYGLFQGSKSRGFGDKMAAQIVVGDKGKEKI